MALHAGAAATGTFTAASATYTGAATTLDLTNATSFGGGSVRFGSSSSIIYDAANSIGVRNGTNGQTFAIYNTFAAGTPDYERLELFWTSNIAVIRTASNGTGAARTLILRIGGSAVAAVQIGTSIDGGLSLGPNSTASTFATGGVAIGGGSTYSATSGTLAHLKLAGTYSDGGTNSTTVVNCVSVAPTINYSAGSKTGKVVGLYINPTNTSLPTGQSAAIGLSSTASALGGILYNNQADEDTNYEKVYEKFNSNVWEIGSVKGGSGTLRGLRFGISGNSIGFLGHAVQALPNAYTLTATQVPTRTLNANASASAANNNGVLSQLIQDLQGYGLLQ